MIIVSDNVATALLLQSIGGPAAVNETMADLGFETARMNAAITLDGALGGEPFATSNPRDLAEMYIAIDDHAKEMLFRQQNLMILPPKAASRCRCRRRWHRDAGSRLQQDGQRNRELHRLGTLRDQPDRLGGCGDGVRATRFRISG